LFRILFFACEKTFCSATRERCALQHKPMGFVVEALEAIIFVVFLAFVRSFVGGCYE
jgi:hypothetical protein